MLLNYYTFLIILSLFITLFFMKTYVFTVLLWLEVITLFFIFILITSPMTKSVIMAAIIIFTLALAVCEASLALACLVNMSRQSSSMNLKALSILKC